MVPVALTTKSSNNKYSLNPYHELMLVHMCLGCKEFSKNRIAGDDNEYSIMGVYDDSLDLDISIQHDLTTHGIYILGKHDRNIVKTALYGR